MHAPLVTPIYLILLLADPGPLRVDDRSGWNEVRWTAWIATVRYEGAPTEVRTPCGMRADIVADDLAIEVEWAEKWKEAPGQAMYYGIALQKRPAIILLWKNDSDKLNHVRLQAVCAKYGVTLIACKTWKPNPFDP